MQYIIRFMSRQEFQKFLNGETLVNTTDWRKVKQGSESIGFCFFPYGEGYDKAEKILRYIAGIADISVAAVFEPIVPIQMKKSFGTYRNPDAPLCQSIFQIGRSNLSAKEEYSVTQYSNKTFRLVSYGFPYLAKDHWEIKWEKVSEEKEICKKLREICSH